MYDSTIKRMGLRSELFQVAFTQKCGRISEIPQFHKAGHD